MRIVTFPAGLSARVAIREMIMLADPEAVTEIREGIWRELHQDIVYPLYGTDWVEEAGGLAYEYGLRLSQDWRGVWRLRKLTYIRPESFSPW
jgi:hypothetical protein